VRRNSDMIPEAWPGRLLRYGAAICLYLPLAYSASMNDERVVDDISSDQQPKSSDIRCPSAYELKLTWAQ
jgi:hypothetical protein